MNDVELGLVFRRLRLQRNLRQSDVARRVGLSADVVSLLERGAAERLSLPVARRLFRALGIHLELAPRLPTAELARLRDRDHAALVERVATILHRAGWNTDVEYTFNNFGERGAVDLLGWRKDAHALALIEAKTRLVDFQDLLGSLDRKARIVPGLLRKERGWQIRTIGRLLVVSATSANRSVARDHAATLEGAFPARGQEARAWLLAPGSPLSALWFLPISNDHRPCGGRQRVRVARSG